MRMTLYPNDVCYADKIKGSAPLHAGEFRHNLMHHCNNMCQQPSIEICQ